MSDLKVGESARDMDDAREAGDAQSLKIDRRTVIKGAVITGAAAVITSKKTAVFAQTPPDYPGVPAPPGAPASCDPAPTNSPPTTPFVDDLPIPATAPKVGLFPFPTKNANIGAGEAARAPHQRWEQFLPQDFYHSIAFATTHRFHRDFSPTYLWTFNGKYPAETIRGTYGRSSLVRFRNNLPPNDPVPAIPEITVHLHNGHTPSESDGFAGDFFSKGLWKDNHYPNVYAGVDQFGGIGDPRERMGTFWYHDHRAEFTAPNNYLGLNGQFILYDQKDPGHENSAPGSLRLPGIYGVTDIPLHLHAILFCPTVNGRTEAFTTGAVPGGVDKWIINGKIQPKFKVRRRKYRFRIVNTGPAKEWNLALIGSDGLQKPMTVVAVDANFLEHPFDISNRNLLIPVASRADVIIDFSQFAAGTSVYLREAAAQFVGVATPDPAPNLPIGNVALRFDVVNRESSFPQDTPPIPSTLIAMPTAIVPDRSFVWRFTRDGDPVRFRINGQVFDHNRVDHAVLKGSSEEWTLANDVIAGNWTHPVHIHFEEGRIMSRTHTNRDAAGNIVSVDNVPLLPEELGRRDVYRLPGQDRLVIRLRFRDFVGRYLIHCHNMNHEDDFMMVRWDIVNTLQELTSKRREIDERRMAAGLPPQYGNDPKKGRLV
jgi:FtsP/CotA-like multicopper oxidase with cupredoxin domain